MRMKKILSMMLIVFMIIAMLPTTLFAADSDVIANDKTGIPDKALYRVVLKTLHKKSGTFTKAEAETVTQIWADNEWKINRDIKTLKGIGNLPNLELLYIRGNALTNLSGIEGLKKLTALFADANKLTDISGIEKLTKLRSVSLSDNQLSDLKGIERLTGLLSLVVAGNKLKSLPDLKNLTALESYDLNTSFAFNKITAQEFQNKLPSQLLEERLWLKKQISFQIPRTFEITLPLKITKGTKQISGRTIKGSTVVLYKGDKIVKKVKANAKGIFTFKKLNFKKDAGRKFQIISSRYGCRVGRSNFKPRQS